MKISTKGRYGLRAMVDIAINSAGDQVSLSSIAERQDVSENYLEHVFSILRRSGLVKSIKGSQGGYMLADSPSKITVGDILRTLEGDLSVVDNPDEEGTSNHGIEKILASSVWEKINKSINDVIDSITLEDLADQYRKLNDSMSFMYYI